MFQSFRLSMTWLHTWFGLVLGYVLMVAFFFGALSVFDREIDRWAIPETRFEPQRMPSFDTMLVPIFKTIVPEEDELEAARERVGGTLPADMPVMNWGAYTTHRDPVLSLFAEFAITNNPKDPDDHVHGHVTIDPRSGKVLPHDQLKVGSGFFYPLHFSLHLTWKDLGYWIVALAALVMMAALVSGVVMHRKIFRELFTFRPEEAHAAQRARPAQPHRRGGAAVSLRLRAVGAHDLRRASTCRCRRRCSSRWRRQHAMAEAKAKGLAFKPAGVAAPMASVDAMVLEAKRRWAARGMPGEVGFLMVNHVGRRQQLREHLSRRQRPCHVGRAGGALRGAHRTRDPRGAAARAPPRR